MHLIEYHVPISGDLGQDARDATGLEHGTLLGERIQYLIEATLPELR